jgi:hypothetical protein
VGLVCACANTPPSASDPVPLPGEDEARPVAPARTARVVDAAIPALAPPAAVDAGPPPGARCGDLPCPLRTWMKRVVAPALDNRDAAALGSAFDELATLAPPGYPNWASIARDGADAARVQHVEAVRGACRGCHSQYRERYKRELGIRGL